MKLSIYLRSPPELVKEIILVDDASQLEHLKDQLDQYLKRWSKVSLNPKSFILKYEKKRKELSSILGNITPSRVLELKAAKNWNGINGCVLGTYALSKVCISTELEFLKRLWGLGSEEEEGYRTGPPGYIGWRN